VSELYLFSVMFRRNVRCPKAPSLAWRVCVSDHAGVNIPPCFQQTSEAQEVVVTPTRAAGAALPTLAAHSSCWPGASLASGRNCSGEHQGEQQCPGTPTMVASVPGGEKGVLEEESPAGHLREGGRRAVVSSLPSVAPRHAG